MFLLLAAVPLFWTGRWTWGWTAVVACFAMALLAAVQDIQEEDKKEIQFNILDPEAVLDEMIAAHEKIVDSQDGNDHKDAANTIAKNQEHGRIVIVTGLAALASKYGKEAQQQKQQQPQPDAGAATTTTRAPECTNISLLCQEAAYIGFDCFPTDDTVVASAAALMALVSKNSVVRERHLHEADAFGLDRPIACMRQALQRAINAEEVTTEQEQASAELQRKSCLLLGALADGDTEIACQIVQEGGLQAILDAVKWYRFHEEVANWSLWALFILCYENMANKVAVVQAGGVPVVIQTMLNVPQSQEVARHGIAILFDLMRDEQDSTAGRPTLDVWRIRNTALTAGLHRAVAHAMAEFCDAMDIMMMGQDLLVGTDYQENIPEYRPIK
jgi:hypothetical protein